MPPAPRMRSSAYGPSRIPAGIACTRGASSSACRRAVGLEQRQHLRAHERRHRARRPRRSLRVPPAAAPARRGRARRCAASDPAWVWTALTCPTVHVRDQPRSRHRPVALDGRIRDAERFGGLLAGHAGEELHLHHLRLAGVDRGQRVERRVEIEDLLGQALDQGRALLHRDLHHRTPSFARRLGPGVVDQDPPHDRGGGAEEVGAVLPLHAALIDQPQVDLVDQRRRRQGVFGPLAAEERPRHPPQVVVDDRRQRLERLAIAGAPAQQQVGDVGGAVHRASIGATG